MTVPIDKVFVIYLDANLLIIFDNVKNFQVTKAKMVVRILFTLGFITGEICIRCTLSMIAGTALSFKLKITT